MYPVSQGFLAELASRMMRPAVRVRTTTGTVLGFSAGSVTMDSRRSIARSCDLTLTPIAGMSAEDVYALVMLPATELVVERGLYVDGEPEYVPLGIFGTDDAEVDKATNAAVAFSGSDRASKISRAHLTDPYAIAAGTTLAAAGTALLQDRYALVQVDFSNVNATIAAAIVLQAGSESDPWKDLRDIFMDHGYDLHFDGAGIARASEIPDPATTTAVYSFGAGEASRVVSAQKRGTLTQIYNGVVASGEGSDVETPVRAVVWDEDPLSPTYYAAGFGLVPYFYSSPLLTTEAACEQAARALLAKMKGRTEQLSFGAIVNPALEPLDVTTVSLDDVARACVLDALTVPLAAKEPMPAVVRETRVY